MWKIAIVISIVLVNISMASSFKDYDLKEYSCKTTSASVISPDGKKKYIDVKTLHLILELAFKNSSFILNYHEKAVNYFTGKKDGFKIYKQDDNNIMIDKSPKKERNKEILSYMIMQGSQIFMTYTCNPVK